MRRRVLVAVITLLALITTACGGTAAGGSNGGPLRIAVVLINTGPFAYSSGQVRAGAELAAETLSERGGRQVELVFVESDGTPANTVQAVTRAVHQEGAAFVTGFFTSATAGALSSQAEQLGALVVDPVAQSTALTGEDCTSNYFRVAANGAMFANASRQFAASSSVSSWDVLAMDYSYGHDAGEQFTSEVAAAGGTVATQVFPPLGTTDFATYITQLKGSPANGLFVVSGGSDAVTFAKQAQDFGLLDKYRAVLGQGFIVPPLLPQVGAAVVGVRDTVSWTPAVDSPAAQHFAARYQQKQNSEAWFLPADVHLAVELIAAAAEKAGSTDVDPVRQAMEGLELDSVAGPVTMRAEDHQLLRPLYGIEVRDDGSGVTAETVQKFSTDSVSPPVDPACSL